MTSQRLLLLALAWAALAVSIAGSEPVKVAGVAAIAALALARDPSLLAQLARSPALLPGALALALAGAFALEPAVALVGSVARAQGVLVGLAALLLAATAAGLSAQARRQVYRGVGMLGGVIAAYALAQRLGLDPVDWHGRPDERPMATLGNANVLAGWLLLALPLTVLAWRLGGVAWLLSVALQGLALLASGTRSAWLSLLAVALLLPLLERRRWRALWLLLPLLAGLAVLLATLRPASVQDRAYLWRSALETLHDPPALTDLSGAPDRWASLRPWTGYGPDQQQAALAAGADRPGARADAVGWEADRAHQAVLDSWLETGVIGLVAALVAVLVVASALRRALDDPRTRGEARWLALALGAWALHLQAGFALTGDRILAWACAGCVLGMSLRPRQALPAGVPLRTVAGLFAGGLLLLAAAASSLVPEAWRQALAPALSAESAFAQGQARYAQARAQGGAPAGAGFAAAAEAFEQAASLRRYDRDAAWAAASARIEQAAAERSPAALARAEDWIEAASRLAPRDPRLAPIRARAAEVRALVGR